MFAFSFGAVLFLGTAISPSIFLHLGSPTSKNSCETDTPSECSEVRTAGDVSLEGREYFVYVIVEKGSWPRVQFLKFGIQYGTGLPEEMSDRRGIDVISWKRCADVQLVSDDVKVAPGASHDGCGRLIHPVPLVATDWSAWPEPGSFIEVGWSEPQEADLLVAGYLHILAFSEDTLSITGIPEGGDNLTSGEVSPAHGPTIQAGHRQSDLAPNRLGTIIVSPGRRKRGASPCGGATQP
jgi:hypothetical protein